ncbi:MAG: OmpA family protein [Pirellulales bacterium]|nr:OmpA family protein [Pirellulales bacterium]
MGEEEESGGGVPEWLVTFGDMMSLLLTFFIMLFSMSEIRQEQKYQAMLEALHQTFGYDTSSASLSPGKNTPRNAEFEALASLGRAQRAHTMKGGAPVKAPVGDNKKVTAPRPDGDPTIAGVVYFNEGDSTLTKTDKRALVAIAGRVAGMPQIIEIRGHTSNKPLDKNSPYRDHADLAYARCRAVEKFLLEQGIDKKRIRLGISSGNELKYDGTDRLLQKENPRVEVMLTHEIARKAKE